MHGIDVTHFIQLTYSCENRSLPLYGGIAEGTSGAHSTAIRGQRRLRARDDLILTDWRDEQMRATHRECFCFFGEGV
jgi:hypothetical protein